jgi:hypothetical protein
MSQDLNNLFRNDPFGFAKGNVLWPGDAQGMMGLQPNTSNDYVKAYANIASGESLFQLLGEKRIWSGDLNRVGAKVVLTRRIGKVDPPAMAMYYLPWSKDQCMRTVLRKTRDQSQRGAKTAIVQNPANPAALPTQNTNDPDIFFTAGVNGCMVVVEGTREEPVVYHCNAISTAGSPLEAAVTNDDSGLAANRIGQKVNWMTTRMSAMSTATPKNPKGLVQTAAARKATIQTDYQMLVHNGKVGPGQEPQLASLESGIARTIGIHGQPNQRIRIQSSQGTVFGHRRNGLWTFYFQKLVCYEVLRNNGGKWQRSQSDLWYVADCREFWPNGAGHAV